MNNIHFENAEHAFIALYNEINKRGIEFANTKALFNVGFYMNAPTDNMIMIDWRKWNVKYAHKEWQWYLSGNPSAKEIAKGAPKWLECMDEVGNVNSNYGYQWNRGDQINYVVSELISNSQSRRASISIYDAKDRYNFKNDTPCTYAIHFYILDDILNMSVMMRSNDLWYGFCNDQYCFSNLQRMIANKLRIDVGFYYHFVNNLHVYNEFLGKNEA